jgi:hypothetical protein
MDLDRCETMIGSVQCGRAAGHEPPCTHVEFVELPPDVAKLIAHQTDLMEIATAKARRARIWLIWALVVNLIAAFWNLAGIISGAIG